MDNEYEIIIVGGGVVGAALLNVLSQYTNVGKILLLEKYDQLGQVNSARNNNSQTLHFGDIETNYNLDKAKKVNSAARLLKNYLDAHDEKLGEQQLYVKTPKMVLGVGEKQVELLKIRFKEFKTVFPKLRLIEREEIEKIEPLVVKGRLNEEKIIALYSEDGYGANYDVLAQSFVEDVKRNKNVRVRLGEEVIEITKENNTNDTINDKIKGKNDKINNYENNGDNNKYVILTNKREYKAKVVVFCSGAHSLIFAKKLGYGLEYGLLPVAGNFFGTKRKLLNGKVYTMQMEKLPFAAIHGDPYVDNLNETRFGPTAKVLPMLERHHYDTIPGFLKTSVFKIRGVFSLFNILFDRIVFKYVLQNFYYDIPFLGKRSFIKEVRKIVPSIKLEELEFRKGYGGIRPQLVNWKKMALEMGDAKIDGENIIFNITPSPGASVCLENARIDALKVIEFLNTGFGMNVKFNLKKFEKELGD